MKKSLFVLCFVCAFVSVALSQPKPLNPAGQDRGMGCVIPENVVKYWKSHTPQRTYNAATLPDSIDWSMYDSPVKNQGGCGSCWAFAAIALVENIGRQSDLSEQVIVSCDPEAGSCGGGWYFPALQYVHDQGVPPEDCYPYAATDGNCSNACSVPRFSEKISAFSSLWGADITVNDIKNALQNGPIDITMRIYEDFYWGYTGGIYHHTGGGYVGNHALLLVGYNDADQCFRVKNSWGQEWGENGYFRISYNEVTSEIEFGSYAAGASGAYTVDGNPQFVLSTGHVDFGTVRTDRPIEESLYVKNSGSSILQISSVQFLPGLSTDSTEFMIQPTGGGISPSDSMKFYITCQPTHHATWGYFVNGMCVFQHNGSNSPDSIELSARSISPPLIFNSRLLSFDTVILGFTKSDSVKATGGETHTAIMIDSVISDNPDFSITPTGGFVQPYGMDTSTFHVVFKPTRMGLETANILFYDHMAPDPLVPDTLTVSGTGKKVVSVTIHSKPVGQNIVIDGNTYSSSHVFTWISGSVHTVTVPDSQTGGLGTRYLWLDWSDGGAKTRTIIPVSDTAFIASFKTQYYFTVISDSGGSVTSSGGWYDSAQIITITATPSPTYNFGTWTGTGNGAYTGTDNPASVSPHGPIAETANFTRMTYRITANAGNGGRISPSGGFAVIGGIDQIFSIVPDSGWQTDSIRVDDQRMDSLIRYTFYNVSSNHIINAYFSYHVACRVNSDWNILSIGNLVNDPCKGKLFPNATTDAFAYEGSYEIKDTLTNGTGYWLRFKAAGVVDIPGLPVLNETVKVKTGWNLIGSISSPVPVSCITSIPPGMSTSKLFGYNNGYFPTDTVMPGFGYWIRVEQDGNLIVNNSPVQTTQDDQLQPLHNPIQCILTGTPPPPPHGYGTTNTMSEIPKEYSLFQNYPNPFNPTTILTYELPAESRVTLRVFNTLGQVIAILVNRTETAGYRQIEWNGSSFPSGVYFYRLETVDVVDPAKMYTCVKKMLLVR